VGIVVWIHIQILYSVPLVFMSVFVPVPVFSSAKLEIKAEQVLLGSEGGLGGIEWVWEWGGQGEMTQTMYAHVSK
jgi:hypothetical protein